MIRCKKCGEEKPEEAFAWAKRSEQRRQVNCRACVSLIMKAYIQAHREENKERARAWRLANPGRAKEKIHAWWKAHPERYQEIRREASVRSGSKRRLRPGARYNGRVLLSVVYVRDDETCYLCGKCVLWKEATLDHVVPLGDGGSHTYANVRLAHRRCNVYRHKKPIEVAQAKLMGR